jgi:hypothetical protein
MKLKVGDAIAWKVNGTLRTGQYLGRHVTRLKSEKKSTKGVDENLLRVWPTRVTKSARKLQAEIKKSGVPFVLVSLEKALKIP